MINLIRADLYKLYKSRSAIICNIVAIIYAIVSVSVISAYLIAEKTQGKVAEPFNGSMFITQGLYASKIIAIIIAIAISNFVTSEFSYGTLKYSIARGFDRTEVYFSKILSASVLSVRILFSYIITSTLMATAFWGFGEFSKEMIIGTVEVLGIQLLLYISLTAVLVMISMIIKNSSGTVVVNLLTLIVLADYIFKIIDKIVGHDFNSAKYWILENMSVLTDVKPQMIDISRGITVAIGYFVVSTLIGCIIFDRYEVK